MKQVVNADPHGKIALQGYDPVAFHTIGGNPAISAEYRGYKYLFSSEANKAMFFGGSGKIPACLRRLLCVWCLPRRVVSGRD
ncbi:MAG: hypothetical protein H6Q47_283 [Deltaproteobacteria bacterium]|nr:hypothetical protein [Deltaproteobacteria bacterium]